MGPIIKKRQTIFDKLRAPLFKALRVKSTVVDGVRISTDPSCPVMRPLRSHLFKRQYEAPERLMIGQLLASDDRVLDIGACTGLTSAICAKRIGSEHVLSYEANPRLQRTIEKNFALNGMVANLRMKAVTSDGRDLTFHITRNVFSSSVVARGTADPITVQSDALGEILATFQPTFVMMDVEGAEDELVAATDLPGVQKLIIETHPHIIGTDRVAAVLSRLASLGFEQRFRGGISFGFVRPTPLR